MRAQCGPRHRIPRRGPPDAGLGPAHARARHLADSADPEAFARGQACCDELAGLAWSHRDGFVYVPEPVEQTITRAARLDAFPVVLADNGDNTASGGSADTMETVVSPPTPTRSAIRALAMTSSRSAPSTWAWRCKD